MLIRKYMYEAYKDQIGSADKKKAGILESEVKDLMAWGERHGMEVPDPEREYLDAVRILKYKGRSTECLLRELTWPLERETARVNVRLIQSLDKRIVESLKNLKVVGWNKLSVVLHGKYLETLYAPEFEGKWVKSPSGWRGAYLILQRLESMIRIAVRYESPDEYGPKHIYTREGELVGWQYGKWPWRGALIRRGLLPRKKRGG